MNFGKLFIYEGGGGFEMKVESMGVGLKYMHTKRGRKKEPGRSSKNNACLL